MKKILLFSTLNPYPFWAGSENFWFDFVTDNRVNSQFKFAINLADSYATKKKAEILAKHNIKTKFYKHFNIDFTRRNIYRIKDKIKKKSHRTLPWYNRIEKDNYDLIWFNVAALADLKDLIYPIRICKRRKIPYWLILQHGYEDFFLTAENEIEDVTEVAVSAKRFIFIAERNRLSLERAIGRRLENAFHSVNALPNEKIVKAKKICQENVVNQQNPAKFFNLGRFSPVDKAQHLLLEAFADFNWKNRDWQLSFIGVSGFGKTYLEKLTGFYDLNKDRIKILPPTDNVFQEISKNDVLLMPSLSEGTPFAMIETMACSRPAFGTPVGGIPELIIENKTGWLAKTVDSADIGEKLEQVWTDREKWRMFGENAQIHIEENFNEEKAFAKLLSILIADTGL